MESLSDIVAQMRGRGEDGRMDRRLWLDYADRIEAAWKREKAEAEDNAMAVGCIMEAARHKPGNAAAAYSALAISSALAARSGAQRRSAQRLLSGNCRQGRESSRN